MRDNAVPQGWQQCRAPDIWRERKHLNEPGEGRYRGGRGRGLPDKNCGLHRGTMQPIHDDLAGRQLRNKYPNLSPLQTSHYLLVPPICWKIMSYKSREPINNFQNDLSIFQSIEQILQLCPKLSCVCLLEQKGKNLGFILGNWIAVSSLSELLKLFDNDI